MSAYGKTITHESVSFRNTKDRWSCFGNWFNTKDQEIGNYYKDGKLTIERVADFLIEYADKTCGYGCPDTMVKVNALTVYEVEVARYWDNEQSTDDVELIGKVYITRTDKTYDVRFTKPATV
jgi:hypothetical protein